MQTLRYKMYYNYVAIFLYEDMPVDEFCASAEAMIKGEYPEIEFTGEKKFEGYTLFLYFKAEDES